jgi:hypothetical protein
MKNNIRGKNLKYIYVVMGSMIKKEEATEFYINAC